MQTAHTNRLIHETSPYLLQHAHNPVDWYPWGDEALQRALREDKPILVSIGYSACHWCHVMERESFGNEAVAAFMNEHFINIKIDREERPDLDHIYMDALQSITGSGGWPLNVFCTSDKKPFFGGTYFPPVTAYNRISWMQLLKNIIHAWKHERKALIDQSDTIFKHLSTSGIRLIEHPEPLVPDICHQMAEHIMKTADRERGGFGKAPKFPQTGTLRFLLAYSCLFNDEKTRAHAEHSLQRLIRGGIYDHLGGGLCRYSTDEDWLVPHFEKMLYDNALLLIVLSEALQLTGKEEYEKAIHGILDFLMREMKGSEGGFFAALDADSEGEEGKYYVWDRSEITKILGDTHAGIFCEWYGISEGGNWEGKNILNIAVDPFTFYEAHGFDALYWHQMLEENRTKLLASRYKRVRPRTDDKILFGWNALLLSGLCKAFAATGREQYRQEARELYDFINKNFGKEGRMLHTFKNGRAKIPAFLDDYAFFIQGCIHLHEITADEKYMLQAEKWTDYVCSHFTLPTGFFGYSEAGAQDVIINKAEIYDGALPSGNSTMAINLHILGIACMRKEWTKKSDIMAFSLMDAATRYPVSFSCWSMALMVKSIGSSELVLYGGTNYMLHKQLLKLYLPGTVLLASFLKAQLPLIAEKNIDKETLIYYCKNNTCFQPVNSLLKLMKLMDKVLS